MREGDGHLLRSPVRPVLEAVRREHGAMLGQVGVQVAGVQLRGRVTAVKQLLLASCRSSVVVVVHGARERRGEGREGEESVRARARKEGLGTGGL